MSAPDRFKPSSALSPNDSLLIAFFIALIIHTVVILSIRFVAPEPLKVHKSLDVTLVNKPSVKPPKQANFLAPENQQGGGDSKQPAPLSQQLAGGDVEETPPPKLKPIEKKPEPVAAEQPIKPAHKVITRKKSVQKVIPLTKPEPAKAVEQHPHLSPALLQQQIAQLGMEIRQSKPSAGLGDIKFINEVSAHKYVAAQYLKDWEMKVERVGNMNYPEAAAKKNFSGTLTMAVTINADGSLHGITIIHSSGNPALDEAAKQIVRMSAPFAPLPLELLKQLNPKILGITRIWKFSDESMTAK